MIRRLRSSRRGEGGFALVTVLAVIAVTSLLIGALFGLMLTTMRITAAQETDAREQRAADAAIETAINEMRTSPCDAAAQPYVDDQVFDQQTAGNGDDVSVDVTCRPVAGGDSATDQVRIVGGDGYKGALNSGWTVDCATNASAPGCMPWAAAVGSVPAGLADSATSLVHTGPEPLRFTSGVTVRAGAAALRNPATGSPAIETEGQYNQGSKGILGTSATDCGMLDGDPGSGAGQVTDMDEEPLCGVAAARDVDAQPTGNIAGLVPSPAIPTVPTSCTGSVMTFTEGTYSAAATAAVSHLTDGSQASCRNITFQFLPGVYLFQGTELKFADEGSSYVFGAGTAGWGAAGVQGAPAVLADPNAMLCNPAVSGTSLVLAGWTRLTHTAGRVAICPAWPDGATKASAAHPALYQQTSVPTGVQVTNTILAPAVLNTAGISIPFKCRLLGAYPGTADYPNGSNDVCRPQRTYELRLATDGQAPVRSLRVMLTGTENTDTPNNLITNRQTRFRLFSSSTAQLCQTDFVTGVPNGGLTSSFDLKTMPGGCSTTALTQPQLQGARLFVDHRMDLGLVTTVQTFTLTKAEVEVNAVSGRVTSSGVTSTSWNNPGNAAVADTAAASPVMPASCVDFVCPVPDPSRTITPATPFVHEMTLSGFTFPGLLNSSNPEVDPSLRTLRAVVKVKPSSLTLPSSWTAAFGNFLSTQNFLTPGTVRLELRTPSGGRCIVQGKGINSDQEIAFDLLDANLDDPTASNCNSFIYENASDLAGATLTLRFELPCVPDYAAGIPSRCLRRLLEDPSQSPALPVWQIRPPDIENVQLTTVTDTYNSIETSTVTSDAKAGALSSSFNVYGRSWLPLADLDINWKGPATAQPLFANDLVVHGMGSRMAADAAMGTVCCAPEDARTVELVATIDGVERLTARVEFSDVRDVGGVPVYEPGFAVNILRWLACHAEGCASVLAASDQRTRYDPGP